jgi:endonuclease G, mitochondrial
MLDGAKDWPLQAAVPGGAELVGSRIAANDSKNLPYNCEHVVPQSWFQKKLPMRGDLHHLFACDTSWNSLRGSLPYADLPEFEGSTTGPEGKLSADKSHFEPAGGRGAVARATLYFLLRYPGAIGDQPGEYKASDLKMLIDWSNRFPVTVYEKHRNQAIAQVQGNRNPLIDFPELANKIDFTQGLGAWGKEQS